MSTAAPSAPPGVFGKTYRIRDGARLHWAGWDDEFVVFNECSGQTHHLDALRAFVLNLLVESPQTWDEALREVRSALHLDDAGSDAADALSATLNEFQQHGLVDTHTA